jgi:DNA-binding NarL/FixJ family response regulator
VADVARPLSGGQPVVVVEDDQGALPEAALSLTARLLRAGGRIIAVGGRAALPAIVRIVLAGATAVNAELPFRRLVSSVHSALRTAPASARQRAEHLAHLRRRADETARFGELTGRECAVLAEVAAGHSAESIARSRPVGLATVRSQISSVLRKLGVSSQHAAVALTYRSCVDRRVMDTLDRFHQIYG